MKVRSTVHWLPGSKGGKIIFVGASLFNTGLPLQTHVSVAKAGVNALSNNLAIELGPFGVSSNVIALGPMGKTEGMDRLTPDGDAAKDLPTKYLLVVLAISMISQMRLYTSSQVLEVMSMAMISFYSAFPNTEDGARLVACLVTRCHILSFCCLMLKWECPEPLRRLKCDSRDGNSRGQEWVGRIKTPF